MEVVVVLACVCVTLSVRMGVVVVLACACAYNSLVRVAILKRCASHPAFGLPARVTTVDKYQGQQNDYVLLSLVYKKSVPL